MPLIIPSYTEKLSWAEAHLTKLEAALKTYADRHPYKVTHSIKQQKDHWRLRFIEAPNREVPLIVGDFLYNVRGGLDHLACALVPRKYRRSVSFPIIREPIWDIPPRKRGKPTTNGDP